MRFQPAMNSKKKSSFNFVSDTSREGFSFIELLVSVTIIMVISSIAVVSFQSANKRARDDRRKADLEKTRAALEMYRTDYDLYPGGLGVLVTDEYMNAVPDDPKDSLNYVYDPDTADHYTYDLYAYMETGGNGIYTASCGDETCNYKLTNP